MFAFCFVNVVFLLFCPKHINNNTILQICFVILFHLSILNIQQNLSVGLLSILSFLVKYIICEKQSIGVKKLFNILLIWSKNSNDKLHKVMSL